VDRRVAVIAVTAQRCASAARTGLERSAGPESVAVGIRIGGAGGRVGVVAVGLERNAIPILIEEAVRVRAGGEEKHQRDHQARKEASDQGQGRRVPRRRKSHRSPIHGSAPRIGGG